MYGYRKGPPHAYTQYGVGFPKVTRQPTASVSQSQVGLASLSQEMNTTTMSAVSEEGRWPPTDHFIFALLVTIFCCLPVGLVALWFAFQSRQYRDSNQRKAAIDASKTARTLVIIALALGCGITMLAIGAISARASMCDKTGWTCVERVFGKEE